MAGEEKRTPARSARPLQDVYAVALGVALVLAVEQIVDVEHSGFPILLDLIPGFLAFVLLSFPIYHWAVRYVDLASVVDGPRRPLTVSTQLAIGTTELLLLIVLPVLVARPFAFLVATTAVLAFEILAGGLLWLSGAYKGIGTFPRRYLLINGASAVAGGAAMMVAASTEAGRDAWSGMAVLAIALARAFAVYAAGFSSFFAEDIDY